jgi:hypothetical protein
MPVESSSSAAPHEKPHFGREYTVHPVCASPWPDSRKPFHGKHDDLASPFSDGCSTIAGHKNRTLA